MKSSPDASGTDLFVLHEGTKVSVRSTLGDWSEICLLYTSYIIKRIRNKQSLIPFKKPEPKLPPHEQAIQALDEIKQQKLWQQGRSKEYYTLITETLRRYSVDRFDINAMEMTSGEILDIIRKQHEADSVYENQTN